MHACRVHALSALLPLIVELSVGQPAVERRVDSLLTLMTIEEKVGQLVQYSGHGRGISPAHQILVRQGRVGSFLNVIGARATRDIQRLAVEESRMKIPLLFGLDVIHGYRTIFPVPLATSCSWDPELMTKAESIAAREATASGVHWTFAPMVDIARDPRWGRIVEGAGEDPYLGSVIAAARVRGFQGTSLSNPASLIACAKHFAAYGGAEGGRDYNTVDISEQTLREIYLPPFHAAVRAGVGTLMSSFNEISGVPSSANRTTLTEILRGEWHFDGFVVSDWGAIAELKQHGIAADKAQAAQVALFAGVDMDMEGLCYDSSLTMLVKRGKVPVLDLDEAVRRILRVKFRLGLFDNPYRNCDEKREATEVLRPESRSLARALASESIVLLRNAGSLLPFRMDVGTLSVIGPLSDDRHTPLGPWDAQGKSEDVISVLAGISSKVAGRVKILHAQGCPIAGTPSRPSAEVSEIVRKSDAVVLVMGESSEMSGEAASRSDLRLPEGQEEFIRAVSKMGKPVVVVLLNGRPLAIPWIVEHVPAVLEAWFPGIETGNAIADILFGDVNPSAKLTTSFPRVTGQVPVYYNHKPTGRPADDAEKFTSRYIDTPSTPLFPFGFGLSYTSFAYSHLELSSHTMSPSDSIVVAVDVRNAGQRSGREIVQLYLHDEVASVTRPVRELKGFQSVVLAPGQSSRVRFVLQADQLAFYDRAMHRKVEPGAYRVYVGPSSAEGMEDVFELSALSR